MIDVKYSIFSLNSAPLAASYVILLPPWAAIPSNAENVAQAICENHFDEDTWAEYFFDSWKESVIVQIEAPAAIVGFYRVEMRLGPKAAARRMSADKVAARRGG